MAVNEFLAVATGPGANVADQATYAADPRIDNGDGTGYTSGIMPSDMFNKSLRQATFMAAVVGQIVANRTGQDALDDGDLDTFVSLFSLAMNAGSGTPTPTAGAAQTYDIDDVGKMLVRTNANQPMADLLPGTGPGILPAGALIYVMNNDAQGMMSIGVGAGATFKNIAGGYVLIGPGETAQFVSAGDGYYVVSYPSKASLSVDTTIYVSPTGNDANTGLTVGTAFQTLQAAWNTIVARYQLNSHLLTVQLADGTYAGSFRANTAPLNNPNSTYIIFKGNQANPGNVTINVPAGGTGFGVQNGAAFTVRDLSIVGTGSCSGLEALFGGSIAFSNIVWGLMSGGTHINVNGGLVTQIGNDAISGNCVAHIACSSGYVTTTGFTTTLVGNPNFSLAYAQILSGGRFVSPAMTYSGASTGSRYQVTLNGIAVSNTGSPDTYWPGNAVGSVASGGQVN